MAVCRRALSGAVGPQDVHRRADAPDRRPTLRLVHARCHHRCRHRCRCRPRRRRPAGWFAAQRAAGLRDLPPRLRALAGHVGLAAHSSANQSCAAGLSDLRPSRVCVFVLCACCVHHRVLHRGMFSSASTLTAPPPSFLSSSDSESFAPPSACSHPACTQHRRHQRQRCQGRCRAHAGPSLRCAVAVCGCVTVHSCRLSG